MTIPPTKVVTVAITVLIAFSIFSAFIGIMLPTFQKDGVSFFHLSLLLFIVVTVVAVIGLSIVYGFKQQDKYTEMARQDIKQYLGSAIEQGQLKFIENGSIDVKGELSGKQFYLHYRSAGRFNPISPYEEVSLAQVRIRLPNRDKSLRPQYKNAARSVIDQFGGGSIKIYGDWLFWLPTEELKSNTMSAINQLAQHV